MILKRLLVLLGLVAAASTLSLIGGSGLPSAFSVPTARADACNYAGEWPNCATQCAMTGNNCDAESDGDVDYAWICEHTGNDCDTGGGGGGGGSSEVYDSYYDDSNNTWVDVGDDSVEAYSAATSSEATAACKTVAIANWAKRRIDGGLMYRIVNRVYFCYNGSSITYIDRQPILDSCCGWLWHFRDWENLHNSGGAGWSSAATYVQAKFEACEAWCYKEDHPWTEVYVYANGTWSWARGH
jgi:hypothetical protein